MKMIKVIAFDLVGVLIKEINFPLNEIEAKIERLFGPNKSDKEFLDIVKENIIDISDEEIISIVNKIINSIYDVKFNLNDLKTLKEKHPYIKLVIATNHLSIVNDYILKTFGNIFDKIYISANIHTIKPNKEFYSYILTDLDIESHEMLFLDDSEKNITGAKEFNIQTVHVTRSTNILSEIENCL